jgi:hypothetical protein
VRLSLRLSDDLAPQLSAICAARATDLSALAREALAAYLTAPMERPNTPPFGQTPRSPHTIDEGVATLLRHWPPEIQQRVEGHMAHTGLSAGQPLLGFLDGWATPRTRA